MRIDLEKPYQDACAREERYQEILDDKTDELWHDLQDEQEAEEFISDYIDAEEPLAKVLAKFAEIRREYKSKGANRPELTQKLYGYLDFVLGDIVDKVAEWNAQRIYDNQ